MPYKSGIVPHETEDLPSFLDGEFQSVQSGIQELFLFERHAEPDKPFAGQLVLADGTDWNPGSGVGFYGYDGTSWRFLG